MTPPTLSSDWKSKTFEYEMAKLDIWYLCAIW
jgi:hypothetical protein